MACCETGQTIGSRQKVQSAVSAGCGSAWIHSFRFLFSRSSSGSDSSTLLRPGIRYSADADPTTDDQVPGAPQQHEQPRKQGVVRRGLRLFMSGQPADHRQDLRWGFRARAPGTRASREHGRLAHIIDLRASGPPRTGRPCLRDTPFPGAASIRTRTERSSRSTGRMAITAAFSPGACPTPDTPSGPVESPARLVRRCPSDGLPRSPSGQETTAGA